MAAVDREELELEANTSTADFWVITCHVHGKVFDISVGQGGQRLRWLAHVAIAKWDEDHNQGWKRLGIPTCLKHNHKDGPELDLNLIIKDQIQNGDHLYVSTSLQPSETA